MSRPENSYTVAEFAEALGTTKDTLLHYDRIGLFRPAYVAENGYRYYAPKQIWLFTQIQNLKKMDIGLRDIGAYMDTRTPVSYVELLHRQIEEARGEIARLYDMIDSMTLSLSQAEDALSGQDGFRTVRLDAVWGVRTRTVEEAFGKDFLRFWKRMGQQYGAFSNTLTGAVRMEEILAGIENGDQCDYLYLQLNPQRHPDAEIVRPQGEYLVGYHFGPDSALLETYGKMVAWAREKDLRFGEYAYEEYLISQIAVADSRQNVTRILIRLRGGNAP